MNYGKDASELDFAADVLGIIVLGIVFLVSWPFIWVWKKIKRRRTE